MAEKMIQRQDERKAQFVSSAISTGRAEFFKDWFQEDAPKGRGRPAALPLQCPPGWRRDINWSTDRYKNGAGQRRYRQKHGRVQQAKYEAAKPQRIPKWADLEAIAEIYAGCPDGFHVDHKIPLQGKTVSGLHVASNLQYLSSSENYRKGNRFSPADDV